MMRIALSLLVLFASLASAQQYRWIDERGQVQYGDTPPASAKDVQRKYFDTRPAQSSAALEEAAQRSPVTLYTSPNCEAPCRDARRLLDRRRVLFSEVSVFDDATLAELKTSTGDARIPALRVGSQALVGLNHAMWNAALDAAQYPPAAATGAAKGRSLPALRLYTNSECGPLCAEARAYLESRSVEFTEVAVEDPEAAANLRKVTGQQNVPVLTVGSFVQRGYDAALYDRALDSAGYPPAAE